jgi:hypothetical protein
MEGHCNRGIVAMRWPIALGAAGHATTPGTRDAKVLVAAVGD